MTHIETLKSWRDELRYRTLGPQGVARSEALAWAVEQIEAHDVAQPRLEALWHAHISVISAHRRSMGYAPIEPDEALKLWVSLFGPLLSAPRYEREQDPDEGMLVIEKGQVVSEAPKGQCKIWPNGDRCTRKQGHEGPCAVVLSADDMVMFERPSDGDIAVSAIPRQAQMPGREESLEQALAEMTADRNQVYRNWDAANKQMMTVTEANQKLKAQLAHVRAALEPIQTAAPEPLQTAVKKAIEDGVRKAIQPGWILHRLTQRL